MLSLVSAVTALLAATTSAAASSLTPPILPLIVRNPYLSTWLANAREEPWTRWPMFYTGQSVSRTLQHYPMYSLVDVMA